MPEWMKKALIDAKQWQRDMAAELCKRRPTFDRHRFRDDIWWMNERGEGVLNIEKALKSPAGRELMKIYEQEPTK